MGLLFAICLNIVQYVFVNGGVLQYVDPLIGTSYWDESYIGNTGDYGNTIPQVGVPNAHSPWSPQTVATEKKCYSPYYYGMRKTHFMSGSCVVEYGSMTIIPATSLNINEALQFHSLNHNTEELSPAYYKIDLTESGTTVEAANENRAGVLRFGLDKYTAEKFYLIVMSFDSQYNMSSLRIIDNKSMELSNPAHRWYQANGELAGFSGHHFVKFSRKALSFGIIGGDSEVQPGATEGQSGQSGLVAAYFEFDISQKEAVMAAVGSSFVSREKAKANLYAELSATVSSSTAETDDDSGLFDLEGIVERVSSKWETMLSAIEVEDFAEREDYNASAVAIQKKIFYTGLWHSLFLPRQHSDYDGQYLSFDGSKNLMQAEGFVYMDDYSTWDVYRATIPLQYLLFPSAAKDIVLSLIAKTDQGGWLPIFPAWNSYTDEMIGDHCAVLIADAYQKGLLNASDETAKRAYEIIRRNAMELPEMSDYLNGKGRRGVEVYQKYGFIPLEDPVPLAAHSREQASRTLEFAYDDYVVGQLAGLLGNEADKEMFLSRSENYRNVIDADGVGFVRGRHANGGWFGKDEDFDPTIKYSWLTEATAWQYTWYVPHNVESLIRMYEGDEAFADKLTSFFEGDFYNHGNEPDHQAAFMYAYTTGTVDGAWRVQHRVRSILAEQYRSDPGGLPGNEDAGQMSSWYVLAGLGLYPVCPGCGGFSEYVISSPLFDKSRLAVGRNDDQKYFTISAVKSTQEDIYIQHAIFNGKEYDCAFIAHSDLVSGGELTLIMGSIPNKTWANHGRKCLEYYRISK